MIWILSPQVEEKVEDKEANRMSHLATTDFFEWSCKMFVQPINQLSEEEDSESTSHVEREFRFDRNMRVRTEAREEQEKAGKKIWPTEGFQKRY